MPRDQKRHFLLVGQEPVLRIGQRERTSDPQFNISYWHKIIASLVSRYNNLRDALKAYGPIDVGYGYADRLYKFITGVDILMNHERISS